MNSRSTRPQLAVYQGELPCRYRQCQHSQNSGRRRYVIAESLEQFDLPVGELAL